MRCWENYHRMFQAEAHVRTILFREETRWPGYYFRSDFPKLDEKDWHCFVNCRYERQDGRVGADEESRSSPCSSRRRSTSCVGG